ncbi:MAG TPA: hypothetical protein VNA25_30420 [Phycisphaerae bacterium]|nr:hypothetical protein [Phycisphaerae bacterium]
MAIVTGRLVIKLTTSKGDKNFEFDAVGTFENNEIKAALTGGGEEKLPWPLGKLRYQAAEGSLITLRVVTPANSQEEA